MTRVIIAAAGSQHKWGGHLGVPKHLAPVDGEPLLARTIRQARTLTEDVHLTCPDDPRYTLPGATTHVRRPHAPNEYISTRTLWNPSGRTILLLGDVYFTDHAIATIATVTEPGFRVFGRPHQSHITGTPYGEIFAASWWPGQHDGLDAHLTRITAAYRDGRARRQDGWTLLRSIQGTDLNRHVVLGTYFTVIDDETDDFDYPADYERHPATRSMARG